MAARLLLATAILTGSLWALAPTSAYACICAPREASEHVAAADIIVLGKVTATNSVQVPVTYQGVNGPDLQTMRDVPLYRFIVQEYIGGSGSSRLEIVPQAGPCFSAFDEPGEKRLLFLDRQPDSYLVLRDCSGSFRVWNYTPESSINVIREEAALQGKFEPTSFTDDPIPPWATTASFGAAALLGAGLLFGVRRLASR